MNRLDKILADANVGTRSQIRAMVRAGRVLVNGKAITEPERKFDENAVELTVNGAPVIKKRMVILMLHKPAGYVTSTDDPRDKTVMELLPPLYRAMGAVPVGRLDKETEGLLLFTNDGSLAHRLMSPKSAVEKTYYARHRGAATEEDIRAFEAGITLQDGTLCLPATLRPMGEGESEITVHEGKYHQVRRMMAARHLTVHYLRRVREGRLTLGDLPLGEVREVTVDEL